MEDNGHEGLKKTIELETKLQEIKQETQEIKSKLDIAKEDVKENTFRKKIEQKFGDKLPSFKFKLNLNIKTWPQKIMHTLREYKRVILVSRKPDIEELSEISKISGIGILIIGFIGFLLQTLFRLLV